MGPFFVVTLQPFLTDLLNLVQRFNHIGVEHIRPIGQVIALVKSILIRLARLDVRQLNRPLHTTGDEPFGNEFRALVEPNRLGLPSPAHHLLKHSDHALHRERHIHFDGQPLPHAFIQYIRHPEPSVAVQRIAIKSPTQTAFGCGITAGVNHNISKSPIDSWPRRGSSTPQPPVHRARPSPRKTGSMSAGRHEYEQYLAVDHINQPHADLDAASPGQRDL